MNGGRIGFRRVVVGLPQGAPSRASVDAAAELAELLNIELLATFMADASLPVLAGLSGARELLAFDRGWQAIDEIRLARDIDRAVNIARRRFAELVRSRNVKTGFDVLSDARAIASLIRADDIVAVIEPSHPGERISWQFTGLLEAALTIAGAVLAVPTRIARSTGPIMTVATADDDRGVRAALEIAVALHERLIIATPPGTPAPDAALAEAERRGVTAQQLVLPASLADFSSLHALAGLQERLRVLSRAALGDGPARLFSSLHGVPLLVVESKPAAGADKTNQAGNERYRRNAE
jgi:hypothetical protein